MKFYRKKFIGKARFKFKKRRNQRNWKNKKKTINLSLKSIKYQKQQLKRKEVLKLNKRKRNSYIMISFKQKLLLL